jgi:hypothetical protein
MDNSFSNFEIITLAVYLLGGDSHYVDTEDVAIKANELAPGRFTWRKYPDQINIKNVNAFLFDAKKPKNGAYLTGSETEGWLLTEGGLKFATKRIKALKGIDLSRERLSKEDKQWRRLERARMLGTIAFEKLNSEGAGAITVQEAESFFRVDDYIVGKARERKLLRILNTFSDDPELGHAVKTLKKKVRKK